MKNTFSFKVLTFCLSLFIFCSCAQKEEPPLIPKTPKVSLDGTERGVTCSLDANLKIKQKVMSAEEELDRARAEAEEAKELVENMRKQKSQFTESVELMRAKYSANIEYLTKKLKETGILLDKQLQCLRDASKEISLARAASAASEVEKISLRDAATTLRENLEEEKKNANKYKIKYEKGMWYKKFFWWTISTVVILGGGWLYFTGATGGLARFIRR